MAAKSRAGRKAMAADGLEDYNYQSNDGSLDSAGFTEGHSYSYRVHSSWCLRCPSYS